MKNWELIKSYHELGINIIPVRDKQSNYKGKIFDVKTPFSDWKKYQTQRITESELYYSLSQNETDWAAFVCGKISNNLFNIDIDTKHYKGFESIYFSDIKNILPDLWAKLRIHKTPSGGYHILYFMSSPPPNSEKLASRIPTVDETRDYRLKNPNVKHDLKSICFLESRGEGALSGFTGEGYSIYINNPIPTLTDQEHESLISLAKSYNQYVKYEKPYTVSKFNDNLFDENPFEHFNNSPEGEKVLTDNGWIQRGHNSNFIWFTRPDSKSKGIHASFNLQKRCYFIFTTSSEFESEKGYNPSTVLSILRFNGDKKQTFAYLQENGFGKIKPKKELQIIKSKLKSKSNTELPENFSEDAKNTYIELKQKIEETYPFGTFWKLNDESKLSISRDAIHNVAIELGFRLYRNDLKLLKNNILYSANERQFQDILKEYIKEEDEIDQEDTINTFEAFMQKNGKYTMSRLPIIDERQLLKDGPETCYKFFKNGFIKVTASNAEALTYDQLDLYVLSEKIQNRDYNLFEGGKYVEYLSLATDWNNHKDHIMKCIGYLSHEFKDETTGYIIVLTEQCPDPKDGGGSGKNVFCNLLGNTTTCHSKNGSQVKFDEKFFQSWSGQRIMAISDVPENFNFAFLKEPSTGTFILKKLFKDEVEIPVEDGPKFIVQTNFSYKITDGGLRRRIIHIEFTDFFTKAGGLDAHFGCHFPKGWSEEDWYGYDTFILQSVQKWLQAGRKLTKVELTETGWEKQFEQTYGKNMVHIIDEYIEKWKTTGKVKTKDLKIDISNYLNENNVPKIYWISSEKQNEAIRIWCEHHNIPIKINIQSRDELGVVSKYFIFEETF